jgi:site-specific recombinase XerD
MNELLAEPQTPPAPLPNPVLAEPHDTRVVPALIADCGEQAAWRYIDFFTANIGNPHRRRAYARARARFLAWCENQGLTLATICPFDVAAFVEDRQQTHSVPGVKQQLAAVRMLFEWLITGQVVPFNPASGSAGRSTW